MIVTQPASAIERVEPRGCEVRVVANIVEPRGVPYRRSPLRLDETSDVLDLRSNRCRVGEPSIERMEKASGKRFCGRPRRFSSVDAVIGHLEHHPFAASS